MIYYLLFIILFLFIILIININYKKKENNHHTSSMKYDDKENLIISYENKLMYSISSYRLGDLVLLSLNDYEKRELLNDYPDSIGASFINELSKNPNLNKINVITNLVKKKLDEKKFLLPDDIEESTIIHLRLGDVIAGNESHELTKRPFSIDELEKVVPKNDKIYIIGKCFFAKTSSKNYDECIEKSNIYLNDVINYFKGQYLHMGNADLDLLLGVACKTFIQGKGYFSKLIIEIRKKLNK